MAAEKNIGFSVTIRGVSKEAQELARLEVQMKSLRKAKLDLIKQSQKEGQVSAENTRKIAALTNQINANAASQKQLKRAITPVQSSFVRLGKTILTSLGIFASAAMVVRGFFNVIKNGFKTSWDFEYAMSQVKAITKATSEDFNKLRENAIALGGATKFTATEVAGLQKEYAKLGFTTKEILRITAGTLDLAAATGSDLATAAVVAGSTLRQFGLDASQMGKVVDVMTNSFSLSALDITKWETSMQHAGPVAKAVGEDIESTSAKLAILANNGLDASISGTSLRNIFLELEKRGLTWDQAMNKINGAQNKASASLELFGKRGAVAGLILADNTEELEDMEIALRDSDGAAKDMADTMQDNVLGQMTKLKSAWEGLTLRTNESNGAMKNFLSVLTDVVNSINNDGIPAIEALFGDKDKQISGLMDRFRFFADMGYGFAEAMSAARVTSDKEVTAMIETGRKGYEKMKALEEEQAKAEDARAKLEAETKAKEEEEKRKELQHLQELIDAEEKADEERKKLQEKYNIEKERLEIEGRTILLEGKDEELELLKIKYEQEIEEYKNSEEIKTSLTEHYNIRRLAIEEEYARKKAEADKKRADEDAAIIQQIFDDNIKLWEDEAKEEAEIKERRNEAIEILEQANKDAKIRIAHALTDALAGIAGKNKALQKASLVADKAVAIAEIIIQTKETNAYLKKWGAKAGPVGAILATAATIANTIAAGVSIAAIISATATALSGFAKGGKINRGIPVNTGTKDDTLIVANKTETVLTKDHVARLGGPGVMKRIGVPGYTQGGYIGQTPPEAQISGFDINQLADLMNSIEVYLPVYKIVAGLKEHEVITKSQPL